MKNDETKFHSFFPLLPTIKNGGVPRDFIFSFLRKKMKNEKMKLLYLTDLVDDGNMAMYQVI